MKGEGEMAHDILLSGKLIEIIETSRNNALRKVNEELIRMYWLVGEYLSIESMKATFGDKYIDMISKEIQEMFPGIRGFNRRGLYRMKQFYELYRDNAIVSPLLTIKLVKPSIDYVRMQIGRRARILYEVMY